MSQQPIKVKRYYVLKGVGYFYKVLAVLSVLIALGGVGFLMINFVGLPDVERLAPGRTSILWQQMIGALVVGALLCLFFATMGQLIDVTLATNEHTRLMVAELNQHTRMLQAIYNQQKTSTQQIRVIREPVTSDDQ